ncbi:aa3-type cytochrome oxidase subunit II [Sanguibacter sp. Z1732]|uniref:aa3-type cytochrome oxidase subunit II n=2 Tax=Micrococcales TaxID=85006 RepID=UPI003D9CB84D
MRSEGVRIVSVPPVRRSPSRRARPVVLGLIGLLVLAGCSTEQVQRGWLPGPEGMTEHTDTLVQFWVDTWIAALLVGVLVWGLLIWCVIVYRKRKHDNTLPVQLRYHLPLELLYTFVPLVMVGVLFYYTAAIQDEQTDVTGEYDLQIEAIGRQWAFDFNYVDEDVWDTGDPWDNDFTPEEVVTSAPEEVPTLVLPVDQTVEFVVLSRDVAHSFWVPAFLYKLDMIPGERNVFHITPGVEGTYIGKCAELCGEFHANMLFNVEVVSEAEFEEHIAALREAGQTGQLDSSLDRISIPSGQRTPGQGEDD